MKTSDNRLDFFLPDLENPIEIPISDASVSAGFPSPAEEFVNLKLDLNKELIKNQSATFFARVSGVSMIDEGINDGDLLVIDKSVTPYDNCIAVCFIDGDFTLKRFIQQKEFALLLPGNKNYQPIKITEENNFIVWGVVRYVIKKV